MKIKPLLIGLAALIPVHCLANDHIEEQISQLNAKQRDDQGCQLYEQTYAVDTTVLMNRQMIKSIEIETGKSATEDMMVLMVCKYLVDQRSHDHPKVQNRKYVWVSG